MPSCHRSKEERLTFERRAVALEVLNHAKSACVLGPVSQSMLWGGVGVLIHNFVLSLLHGCSTGLPANYENDWVMFAALRMFGSRARTVDASVLTRLGLCSQNLSESLIISL